MTPRAKKRTSLKTIARRALEGECALPSGTTVVIAVSGGPDSMALLDVLARLKQDFGLPLLAHGVDHGLRALAASELDVAEAYAHKLGVAFGRTCVKVAAGGNVQARARKARWEALTAVARRHNATIATAHHADDRAETLLMRMMRGSGARGLGVLPPRAEAPAPKAAPAEATSVIRPLLRARRLDIEAHVGRNDIPHVHDPSNVDPRYLRTSVRREVLPLLAKLDPNIVHHLEAIADELSETNERKAQGTSPLYAWAASLPRATQDALLKMTEAPSSTARVWLPGGLVVSADPRARTKGATQARTRVVRSDARG